MAKEKNFKKTKKNNNYDDKIIKMIAAGLGAFVLIVVAIVIVITMTTGYVAKVDGVGAFNSKIYDYEYNYFLDQAIYEIFDEQFEEPEGYDDMKAEEKEAAEKKFWTDEKKNEAADKALEDARQFKAQYKLAIDNGFKLSSDEKANLKANLDNYYNQYLSYGYNQEMIESMMFGGMSLSEYKDFAIIQTTIENYKASVKEDIDVTDADIKAVYDEEPNDYRKIDIRQFMIEIEAKKPTDKDADDYKTKDDAYKKEYAEAKAKAEEIIKTFNDGKKMLVPKTDEKGNEVKDDKGNTVYEKEGGYTFEEYIVNESDDPNSKNGGAYTINNNSKGSCDEVTDYALSLKWNEDRTKIVEKDEDVSKFKGSKDPKTELKMIETENAIYIVRAENITDLENSKESSEGAEDSIKDVIKATLLEEKAVEKLEANVNEKKDEFALKSKKEDELKKLNDERLSEL